MKIVIQRVLGAQVEVGGEVVGKIAKGYLILFGAADGDTDEDSRRLADKISKLRIFEDENGKTNLSIFDVGGEVLSVSQFTLLADCSHGNRPSFTKAAQAARRQIGCTSFSIPSFGRRGLTCRQACSARI